MPHKRVWALIILLVICPSIAFSQRRGGRGKVPPSQQTTTRNDSSNADQYWAAQRSIEAAIQQLESYLRANSNGDRAATARQQLEVLRSLSVTASLPEWVNISNRYANNVSQWRIASVDLQTDKTKVTIEIRCPRQDGGDCYFDPFDRNPLVLVDSAGRYYPMIDAGALPQDVRITGREHAEIREGQAVLTGGRSISVTVDFAPLTSAATSGQVYYRDNNRAEPARFSLLRRR